MGSDIEIKNDRNLIKVTSDINDFGKRLDQQILSMEANMNKKIDDIDRSQHKQFTNIVDEYIKRFE